MTISSGLATRDGADPVWHVHVGYVPGRHHKPIRHWGGRTTTDSDTDNTLMERRDVFTDDSRPTCAWLDDPPYAGDDDLPDFFPVIHLQMMTEAMRRVLEPFDLTGQQILEMPLYRQKKEDPDKFMSRWIPDETKPIPGPWYTLYLPNVKDTLIPEACENTHARKPLPTDRPYNHSWNTNEKPWVLALHGDAANTGPDLWREARVETGVLFFSDRLKRAIEASGLDMPMFRPKPCKLL